METVNDQYSGPEWETTASWLIEKNRHMDKCFALLHEFMPTFPDDMEKEFLMEFDFYPYSSLEVVKKRLEEFVKVNGPDGWKTVLNERFKQIREILSGNENIATHGIKGVDEEIVYS